LAASGVNPASAIRDLHALEFESSTPNAQAQGAGWDPDTNKYVAQLQQQSTMKMIAEGIERAHRNFDAFLEENVDIDWEVQRKKIYEHFGLASKGVDSPDDGPHVASPGGKGAFGKTARKGRGTNVNDGGKSTVNRSGFGNSSLQKSVIGTARQKNPNASPFADVAEKNGASTKTESRFLQDKQAKYADSVQKLNQERMRESIYPILHEFSTVEGQPGDEVRGIQTQEALRANVTHTRPQVKL
jgi:nuclear pore complex protein Nup93